MKKFLSLLAIAALTIGLLGSCEKEDPKVSVAGVTLEPTTLEITVGDDVKLTATVAPENATDKTISWSSDKDEVASVDKEGNVYAIAAGSATITVTTTDGGKTATCAVIVKAALPEGALSGKFTVNVEGKKVHFSKGNLHYDGTNWGFEAEQYYFRTYDGKGKCDADGYNKDSGTTSGHWGLFGWSTAKTTYGISISTLSSDYTGNFVDWGIAYCESNEITTGTWRTLSTDEWQYLFNTRTMTNGGARYENLTSSGIAIQDVTFKGMVLYPDDFTEQATWKNTYKTWEAINSAGLVFLPAAGCRYGSDVDYVGVDGFYWSSSTYDENNVCLVFFDSFNLSPDDFDSRVNGFSVRLITVAE